MKDLGNTIDLAEKLEEHLEYEVLKPEEQEKKAKDLLDEMVEKGELTVEQPTLIM